eukprot:TRINITY_DN93603_c0_g1_i1.p1 TRINITY_DN93603_c0_g1~~TRINITY_DN93603_c0_g1_i1.p1  ORF type:complete len:525 (+),score=132.51 TRINITY_DN93603_c0_g1_i1:32-1576(+)
MVQDKTKEKEARVPQKKIQIKPEQAPSRVPTGEITRPESGRYWPGRQPRQLQPELSTPSRSGKGGEARPIVEEDEEQPLSVFDRRHTQQKAAAPVVVYVTSDPRLDRLRQKDREIEREEISKRDEPDLKRRRREESAEAETQAQEEPSGETKEDPEARRRQLLIRLKQERLNAVTGGPLELEDTEYARQREEAKRASLHDMGAQQEVLAREEDASEEADDEEEDDNEPEESGAFHAMAKPIFVRKEDRETVKERERVEAEELAELERKEKQKEQRQRESKQLVVETLKREADQTALADSDEDMPDDDDEVNEAEEYEMWKVREIQRVKEYREEREKWELEKLEVERRRRLTDAERAKEDAEAQKLRDAMVPKEAKWKFMQKYYHKGAFFMDTAEKGVLKEEVYRRDYGLATGEDKFDKEMLPKIMQVKNFGKRGRVKWTHLVNEDTTQRALDSAFTTGTALAAVKGSVNFAANMTYDQQKFTYSEESQKMLGSANYGNARSRDQIDRPAARRYR